MTLCLLAAISRAAEPATPSLPFGVRIQQNQQLVAWCDELSDAGDVTLSVLVQRSHQLGRMLSLDEFCQLLQAPLVPLKSGLESKLAKGLRLGDYDILWLVFAKAQHPPLERTTLIARLRTARESMRTLQVKYTATEYQADGAETRSQTCEFACDGPRLYFDRSPDFEHQIDRKVDAYDGQMLRELFVDKGRPRAAIQNLDHRARFVKETNPLVKSGLVNTYEFDDSGIHFYDLARQAKDLTICEQPELFEGVECLVLGSPDHRYYLAPKFNYALLAVDSRFRFDKDAGKLRESAKYSVARTAGLSIMARGCGCPA